MKTLLRFLILINPLFAVAQITTPVIRANFGVDADLRANYFNGFVQIGNDDWYNNGTPGTGQFIIDTTGAATIVARYGIDPASRRQTFYRTMRFPQYSIVNNRLLLDAVFIRDYHGDDSTVFASGSNKNGDSPVDWSCPVSQGIPDKNDILDMFVHVRRAGPNTSDSLWMMGGLSLDNTTGDRYFDFEMYQTDIYYDRPSRKFYNYGPDAGHTSWQFDAAGNVIKPGDIILTAEYQSSSLTFIEARIWVNASALMITPAAFRWSGKFDGAGNGATYGYASIQPLTTGAYYTGLQCANNTWGGPFSIVLQNNTVVTNYAARQFVEFSVNLTKLGLDPVTLLGGDVCGMPFRRILVKTRASASFTAELKDFVGPIDLFIAPRVNIAAELPIFCGSSHVVSDIYVTNPSPSALYMWSTPNGHIITNPPQGPTIRVDSPGTYIVTQYLQAGCSAYATDTVYIVRDTNCHTLPNILLNFQGGVQNKIASLNWTTTNNQLSEYFDIERSENGVNFLPVGRVLANYDATSKFTYDYADNISNIHSSHLFYRLRIITFTGQALFSNVIHFSLMQNKQPFFFITPNPVRNNMQMNITAEKNGEARVMIYDNSGKLVKSNETRVQRGNNSISFEGFSNWPTGIYAILVQLNDMLYSDRMVLIR